MTDRFYFDELHETGSVSQVFKSRPVRYALVFSVAVLGAAFLLTPQLTDPNSQVNQLALSASGLGIPGVDPVTTGSIGNGKKTEFILRRSILGNDINSMCIIREDGSYTGSC